MLGLILWFSQEVVIAQLHTQQLFHTKLQKQAKLPVQAGLHLLSSSLVCPLTATNLFLHRSQFPKSLKCEWQQPPTADWVAPLEPIRLIFPTPPSSLPVSILLQVAGSVFRAIAYNRISRICPSLSEMGYKNHKNEVVCFFYLILGNSSQICILIWERGRNKLYSLSDSVMLRESPPGAILPQRVCFESSLSWKNPQEL